MTGVLPANPRTPSAQAVATRPRRGWPGRLRLLLGLAAPVLPAAAGAIALVILFFVGHFGVKDSVRRSNLMADAEAQIAIAASAGDPAPYLAAARELTLTAGEARLAALAAEAVPVRDLAALDDLLQTYGERRSAIQHRAETRFLYLSGTGLALLGLGVVASLLLWRRRWVERWRRVQRLAAAAEALADRPLDAAIVPSGASDELGRLEEVLSAVASRLAEHLVHQQRISLLGEHVAFVAHDIRNPLSTITMGLSLLDANVLDPDLRDQLVSEARRATALAEDLRNLARRTDAPKQCDLAAEVEASARFTRARAARAGVTLSLDPHAAVVPARSNEIQQVLINLIENAIDAVAGSPRREVLLSSGMVECDAVLRVEDSGPGIPPEARDRIFETFYTSKESGTGLGLAIVRRIVQGLGGSIEVGSSDALGGAAFIVRLPACEGQHLAVAGQLSAEVQHVA
ncbi:HAMP domain-containing sensor histidine kinase [Tepidiforma sp.]|uniref:sensor histidine kinase n=1 Tax=Tepidiforma sp. TaxID=2682230 RepID=UPI002ADD634B|nr:HAMP domain-containing sensor histidine kinase [Tepidiforma sp.]